MGLGSIISMQGDTSTVVTIYRWWVGRDEGDVKPDYTAVPSVVFSSPQLAYVGKKEDAAVEEYQDVDIYTSKST